MHLAKKSLDKYTNINFYQLALSNKKEMLRFDIRGSSSKISTSGEVIIYADKLDDIIEEEITFIKMDIEGAERKAIMGSKKIILKYHPILAISVYHRKSDFWKIPKQILKIRKDYKIYLRHYTERVSETIMYFIPHKG